ncbi:MAG: MinD/ParA family protein [Kiritimatiellae bacterium]|nr:MinD/ParA family protein [Kiritimatiellia bacterium]
MSEDQAAALRKARQAGPGSAERLPGRLRCIAVASGKGGVGKTFVSVGLGYSLAQTGSRVLVLDADLGLANVDLQVGADPTYTLQDVLFGTCTLEEAVVALDNGPSLLAAASGAPEMVELGSARRQMFVDELLRFAAGYDYLIIDVAAGIGGNVTNFLAAAPEVLVVVANEPTSVMDAYALIKTICRQPDPPFIMTVINMVRSEAEGRTLARHLDGITRKFLGVELTLGGIIPYDVVVTHAIRARRPVVLYAADSAPAKALKGLAGYLAFGKTVLAGRRDVQKPFFDKLVDIGKT